MIEASVATYTAGTDLEKRRRVKFTAANTVGYSGAGEDYIGVTEFKVSSGDQVGVRLRSAEGTMEVTAAGAISAGTDVYGAANGKITASASGAVTGTCPEAATADGDLLDMIPK